MQLQPLILTLAVLVLAESAPVASQVHKPWPPAIPNAIAECNDHSINQEMQIVRRAFSARRYAKVVALANLEAESSEDCFDVYSHPIYLLRRAWFKGFLGAAYVQLDRMRDAKKAFDVAKADLASVDDYALPASVKRFYSGAVTLTSGRFRSESSVKPLQIAIDHCTKLVIQHGHFAGTTAPANKLDKQSRIATCVGDMGFMDQAIRYLKDEMHRIGDVTIHSVGTRALQEDLNVTEAADARLAILEFRAGKVAEARNLVRGFYGNTPEMKAAWSMIDPAGHRKMMAKSDAEARAYDAQFSVDELKVLKLNGSPCNTSRSKNAYTGIIEIWYYDCVGEGDPGIGRESFTFVNGVLTNHTSITAHRLHNAYVLWRKL